MQWVIVQKILYNCCIRILFLYQNRHESNNYANFIYLIQMPINTLIFISDFYKMGGFPALLRCLNSPHASLRVGAAGLIGDICQNNLVCQESMLSLKAIPPLLEMMDTDTDKQARIKSLYAISCK